MRIERESLVISTVILYFASRYLITSSVIARHWDNIRHISHDRSMITNIDESTHERKGRGTRSHYEISNRNFTRKPNFIASIARGSILLLRYSKFQLNPILISPPRAGPP